MTKLDVTNTFSSRLKNRGSSSVSNLI